jgi:hypothetical protein
MRLLKALSALGASMFECKFYCKGSEDIAYWVSVSDFRRHFDQHDFTENREAKRVIEAYSKNWFYTDSGGVKLFELPAVSVIDEKTQFISGRHRVSVLLNYLDFIPIAFASSAMNLASTLNLKTIDRKETIELPELPFENFE